MAFILPAFTAIGSFLGGGTSALSIGGAILSAGGTLVSAIAGSNAANYNAKVAEQQAKVEEDKAAARASNEATKTRLRAAATRAGSLQNGFELDGSVLDLIDTVETQGKLDELTAMWDGTTRAQGLRNSAELSRSQARGAMIGGLIGAGNSFLSGYSKSYLG